MGTGRAAKSDTRLDTLDINSGFSDPDYFLLRESEAQLEQLAIQTERLRDKLLTKLKRQEEQLTDQLKRYKAERKRLNKLLKQLEASDNTSIIAQSEMMEVAKPLVALEGTIAELEIQRNSLDACRRQLKIEKREATLKQKAIKSTERRLRQGKSA